jgi:hypothetical protein
MKQTPLAEARFVGIGQKFQQVGDTSAFMLCQVAAGDVLLINTDGGNRWDDNVVAVADVEKLTKQEIERVFCPSHYNWVRLEGKR